MPLGTRKVFSFCFYPDLFFLLLYVFEEFDSRRVRYVKGIGDGLLQALT